MIRALYDWTIGLAGHRYSLIALAVIAFLEASVFPIPPDLLMIPMILARPAHAVLIAGVTTAFSVVGGLFGYWIGAVLYDSVGLPVLEFYGKDAAFGTFRETYNEWGAWVVLVGGSLTPIPYKVITILSGATALSLPVFIIASVVARGSRFFLVAWLLRRYGAPIRVFIEQRLVLMFTLFIVLLVGGFVAVGYL